MSTLPRTRRPARPRAGARWWLWTAIACLAAGAVFAALLVMDLTSPTPGRLTLPQAAAPSPAVAAGPISGTWKVGSGSQVGYRVHEVLFGLSHVAVGRTHEVTGGMTVSGSQVVAADFTVQMRSVETDQAGREVMWRRFIMNTGAFPTSHFRLSRAIHLGKLPAVGTVVTVPASGELTLRGVTQPVHFTIRGERVSRSVIDVNAAIPITFARWQIPDPSFAITKVSKSGTLEVLLRLTRAGQG